MEDRPGKNGKIFTIKLNKASLQPTQGVQVEITKVYKDTLYRKIIRKLGFRILLFKCKLLK